MNDRPARSREEREHQLSELATDLAEKQLRDGTASSQVITHYLKVASTREKKEMELLETQRELMVAKADNLRSAEKMDEMFSKAMDVMGIYSGKKKREDEEDEY